MGVEPHVFLKAERDLDRIRSKLSRGEMSRCWEQGEEPGGGL